MFDQYSNFDIDTLIKAMQAQQTPQYGQFAKTQDAPLANNVHSAVTPAIGIMPSYTEQQHQNNLGTYLQMMGVGQSSPKKKSDKSNEDNTDLFDDISNPANSKTPMSGVDSYTSDQHKSSLGTILALMGI